jgi:transcriptional regulator with XRE-family HTH domain
MTASTFQERLTLAMEGKPRGAKSAMARACGISPTSVNDWTSGKTKMVTADLIFPAARYLGVSAEWLATGRGQMHVGSEIGVKSTAGEGQASQSWRPDAHTLRQAIRFTRTFLLESGEVPDLEANAPILAAVYEGVAEADQEGADPIAFMGKMLAKLQGVERANERQADRDGSENTG